MIFVIVETQTPIPQQSVFEASTFKNCRFIDSKVMDTDILLPIYHFHQNEIILNMNFILQLFSIDKKQNQNYYEKNQKKTKCYSSSEHPKFFLKSTS
jgi:hypothetical protein